MRVWRGFAGIWGNSCGDLRCFAGDGYEVKPEGRDAPPIFRYGYMQHFLHHNDWSRENRAPKHEGVAPFSVDRLKTLRQKLGTIF
jgi:hypothetical protein